MENQKISINFNINELNYVMSALGRMPYAEVTPLIDLIREQAKTQIEPATPAAE